MCQLEYDSIEEMHTPIAKLLAMYSMQQLVILKLELSLDAEDLAKQLPDGLANRFMDHLKELVELHSFGCCWRPRPT